MSENKKPELFDVWGDGFVKVFVIFSDQVTTEFLERWNGKLNKRIAITREFVKAFRYLGKSKADIIQLFEVLE